MKKTIWDNGIGFLLGGGLAMAISIQQGLSPFWIGFIAVIVGIICMVISHYYYDKIGAISRRQVSEFTLILGVFNKRKEARELLNLKDNQRQNPEQWLYPVIEYIDLNRQGNIKVDAVVKFQIDSHLLFPINEFYVFVKLCLYDTATYQEADSEDWHEIEQPEHYASINKLERHGFGSALLNFRESVLLEMIEKFRNGEKINAMLKIGVALKKEDKDNPIVLEGSRWIAPMNDYRGG